MFSYGLLIFLGLHLKYSVCVGEGILRFSVVVACLSMTVLNNDSTHFPPPLLQPLLMDSGQCGGKVFASQGWWGG